MKQQAQSHEKMFFIGVLQFITLNNMLMLIEIVMWQNLCLDYVFILVVIFRRLCKRRFLLLKKTHFALAGLALIGTHK